MTEFASEYRFYLADEGETEALGAELARLARASGQGLVVFLEGDLGMGKTTLSRGVMRALGHSGAVKSPTYTLVEPYEGLQPPAYHFDLYRLGDPEELEYMGIRDYFSGQCLCLIEWPERGAGLLPAPDLEVRLSRDGQGRAAVIRSGSALGAELLNSLRPAGLGTSAPGTGDNKSR